MDPIQDRDRAEEEVVALLAAARRRDRAPTSLRARIEHDRTRARARRFPEALPGRLGRRAFGGGLAAAVAAAVLIVALAVPSGSSVLPSISQATALALKGPSSSAPATHGGSLQERVGEVAFPNWSTTLGYTAFGERRTTIAGHQAVTVYYRRGNETVAYLVFASGARLPAVPAQQVGNVWVRALRLNGNAVVTWRRGHDTCVLVSQQLSTAELASLADWTDRGRIGAEREAHWEA